jgi:hypothetical protein
MSALTRLAFDIVQSTVSPPGLKAVACATLLAAMDQAVDVPHESHMAVWRYLLASDASAAMMHRHQLVSTEVARGALQVLGDADAGEAAQDLALAVLRGSNVAEIGEQDLVSLADRILDEGRVHRVAWLVEQVHEQRGLEPEFVVMLRDRLAGSDDAAVRAGGVTVGALLARFDEIFAARMLVDPSPQVRIAVAEMLDGATDLDRDKALRLIRDQLGIETHRSVIAALYCTLGTLVRAGGRSVRQATPDSAH